MTKPFQATSRRHLRGVCVATTLQPRESMKKPLTEFPSPDITPDILINQGEDMKISPSSKNKKPEEFLSEKQTRNTLIEQQKTQSIIDKAKDVTLFERLKNSIITNSIPDINSFLENNKELILSKDHNENTLFHIAAQNNIETLRFLCKKLTSKQLWIVNEQNNEGSTPLHNAAYKGNAEAMRALLFYNAEINIANSEGVYPLDELLKYDENAINKKEEIECKINVMADLLNRDYSIFIKYSEDSKKYYFNSKILENYKDQYKNNEVLLFLQKIYNFFEKNENIFPALPSNQQDHSSIAFKIIKAIKQELLKEFLNEFPEFNFSLNDVLLKTVRVDIKSYEFAMDMLINKGADPLKTNKYGNSPLAEAFELGEIKFIRKWFSRLNNDLIKNFLDLNDKDFCLELARNIIEDQNNIFEILKLDNTNNSKEFLIAEITDCYELLGHDSTEIIEIM